MTDINWQDKDKNEVEFYIGNIILAYLKSHNPETWVPEMLAKKIASHIMVELFNDK